MKTFLLSSLFLVQSGKVNISGDLLLFFNAFLEALIDIGIFLAGICIIVFAVVTIKKKIREREIAKELKSRFDNGTSFLVLKTALEDFFYEGSDIKDYFDYVEVIFKDKTFEAPEITPVKITKLRLSRNKLKAYVKAVEMECDFDVTWVGKSFGEKPLGDDAMRVSLQNINFGSQQVSRQKSQIPETVEKGDKVRMKFVKDDKAVKLMFVKTL